LQISFHPVTHDHLPMLKGWLEQPHMQQWWGDPDTELGYIRDMVEGRDTTRPFIFHANGKPAGYIQYWFACHHQNDEWTVDDPWLKEIPADAIGVDLSIGEEGLLSKGIGSAALNRFSRKLAGEGHSTIIIDPDVDNARAIRAYEKAGYRAIAELKDKTGDTFIMQFDPDGTNT
jgi:RimJ/RimL family protein N-acetyltransferase